MNRQQIENKIEDLNFWLTHNPSHLDSSKVLSQKRDLEAELAEIEKEENETANKDNRANRSKAR